MKLDTQFVLTAPGSNERLADSGFVAEIDNGIWDFTQPERRPVLDRFADQYARVRAAEHRELTPAQIVKLPEIAADHPLADMWNQRAASAAAFEAAIAQLPAGSAVDIGAGCGWFTAGLARNGWTVAATDITITGGDGLASARHHAEDLLLMRAEMQALPFASASVDLAVFNASLHYAGSVDAALREAFRVLRPGGTLAVLDSPLFHDEGAGRAMVHEFAVHAEQRLGVEAAPHEGPGFITHADVAPFSFTNHEPRPVLRTRWHRWRGARLAGRETATRPLLIATAGDHT